jgi:O-antigen/teichoic acid export membrane protein
VASLWSKQVRALITYGLGEFLSKAFLFLLIPVLGSSLSAQDFGAFGLFYPAVQTLQPVFSFGLTIGLSLYLFGDRWDPQLVRMSTAATWMLCAGLVVLGAAIWAPLPDQLGGIDGPKGMITLLGFGAVALAAQLLQLNRRPFIYVLVNNGSKIAVVVVTVAVTVYLGLATLDIVLSAFCAVSFTFGALSLMLLLTGPPAQPSLRLSCDLLWLGLPTVVSAMISFLIAISGRAVLTDLATLREVAILAMVQSLAQAMTLFYAALSRVVAPTTYRRVASGTMTQSYIDEIFAIFSPVLTCATLACAALVEPVLHLIDKDAYIEIGPMVYVLLASFYIQIYYAIFVDIAYAERKTISVAFSIVMSLVITILLTYSLFPSLHIWGAVIANALGMVTQFAVVTAIALRTASLRFVWTPFQWPLLLAGAGMALVLLIRNFVTGSLILAVTFCFSGVWLLWKERVRLSRLFE